MLLKYLQETKMKKSIFGIVLLIILFSACVSSEKKTHSGAMTLDAAIAEAAKQIDARLVPGTIIAPLNFNSTSERFSSYVLEELTANLVHSGKLFIVDRREINLIRDEFNFQYSGDVDDDSMQALGRMLGAASIISGSLIELGEFSRIVIRVLNVQNASVEVHYRTDIVNDNRVAALLANPGASASASANASANAQAAGTPPGGQTPPTPAPDFRWQSDNRGGIIISGYEGATRAVVIPGEINRIPVRAIADEAFKGKNLTSVTIPASITTIGDSAFAQNQLTSISIPNSVTYIGAEAFSHNRLTSVIIPNRITSIEYYTFGANQLNDVVIPSSVTSIGRSAFHNNRLTNINIPNSVTTIGDRAFGHNGLTSLIIPGSVTSIGDAAFSNNQLISVTIPNSVTNIGADAFRNNRLPNVTIPNSVISIGTAAFRNNRLTEITISNRLTGIADWVFAENQLAAVTIPASVTSIGMDSFAQNQLTSITIPNSVTSIGWDAFRTNRITSVTIGANVRLGDNILGRPANFNAAYIGTGSLAGTYIRSDTNSSAWTRDNR